jgi:hypothetical protein
MPSLVQQDGMTASADRRDHATLSPEDWDDPAERRYAERQSGA